eukprot:CAMPEP_0184480502 /NCGR_PEP_ID=MMETSP0113_2-20130426/2020_1 /TAXON_ID=91329 /ORGANISM="Norrisiella sphaerica, Strain BC52" /LENGTH=383 /DNA_ID=CAMNT_0026859039 /DNA_START=205 /DNA_END=1356 /DNA_ORIENTATION=-
MEVVDLEEGGGPREGLFDDIIMDKLKPNAIKEALQGRSLTSVCRKGKHIWWEMSGVGPSILFHFGMTGAFIVMGIKALKYQGFKHNSQQWPPKFTKLRVVFDDNCELAFCDPRRLGRIRLRNNAQTEEPISILAPDPYASLPAFKDFRDSVLKRNKSIKAVLLDQGAVLSGIGNWVCDEILYHGRISPSAVARTLDDEQLRSLLSATAHVVNMACKVDAESSKFPKDWLFHLRWGVKKAAAVGKDTHGNSLKVATVAGRTTVWVPKLQRAGKRQVGGDSKIKGKVKNETPQSTKKRKRKPKAEKDDVEAKKGRSSRSKPKRKKPVRDSDSEVVTKNGVESSYFAAPTAEADKEDVLKRIDSLDTFRRRSSKRIARRVARSTTK